MFSDSTLDLIFSLLLGCGLVLYALGKILQIIKTPSEKMEKIMGKGRFILAKPWLVGMRIFLYSLVLAFVAVSLYFNWGEEKENKESVQGVDILFVIDTSLSMNAVDASPTRLERFKELLLPILPELQGNRLGILAFAGSPFLFCPFTTDIHAFGDFLRGLDVDIIADKGSEMGSAFRKANELLQSDRILRNRLLVLVSDGEDHSSANIPELSAQVIVWGLGDEFGSPIYYNDPDTKSRGYVTKQGTIVPNSNFPEVIQSTADQDFLREFARTNKGQYFNLTKNGVGVWKLLDMIEIMEKNSNRMIREASRNQKSHLALIPVSILLLLDYLLLEIFILGGIRRINNENE